MMRLMKRIFVGSAMTIACGIAALAQSPKRVAVATQSGDGIEGVLRSVSDAEIVLEVGSQPLRLPMDSIRYVSFVGTLSVGSTSETGPSNPMDLALKSLRDVMAATEVGILRVQYSEKLVANLPAVQAFVKSSGTTWQDVKTAMDLAVHAYQSPLGSLESWQYAGGAFTRAATWVTYSADLMATKDEETHLERPAAQNISIGSEAEGHLGHGDATVTKALDIYIPGGFADEWLLEMKTPARVIIQMTCTPCRPRLFLTDDEGKRLDADDGPFAGNADMKKQLKAGRYHIWTGTFPGQVGAYGLSVHPQ